MDDLDLKIIKLLQLNARITASDIGKEINMSVPAVTDRIKKLEAAGVIMQYTAVINPKKFGKELTAIMYVSLERPKYIDKFLEFVKEEDDILECHYLAGDYDYALKIITENTDTLERLLNKIKAVQGIQKTKTSVALSTIKSNFLEVT